MQLAKAIEAWVAQNGAGLSSATKRDIATIGVSAAHCGMAKLECSGLSDSDRRLLINEASESSSLSDGAIEEFLSIVLRWGSDRDDPVPADDDSGSERDDIDDADPRDDHDLDTDESDEDDRAPDERDTDDADGELQDDEELDDDGSQEAVDDQELENEDLEAADGLGGYLDMFDLDDEDLVDVEEDDDVEEDTGAAAFRAAAAASAVADEQPLDVPSLPPGFDEPSRSGAFSAAAMAPKTARGKIDWVTVMYFGIAAVCFALVIILYLSS